MYESQDNSLAPLFQQNQELRALVESLKEENDRLRQAAFTFVAPPSLPGTSSNSFESFAHPTVQEDIFAVPHAHKSPASDNDTGYSSGHAGSPSHSSESFEETGPGLSALESQGSLQLVDVLKDMDAADARQLLMNLLAQQQEQLQLPATTVAPLSATPGAAVAMAQLPPFAPISISPPTTEEQELIDGVLESASNAGYFNAPSWDAFDPQLVDLMSVILPQGTEDYNTLAGFLPADQTLLPEPSAFSPSSMLAPQAPLGIGIPDADVALFGGDSVAVDAMDWQHLVEPTRKPYMETLPMLTQAIRAPELRLPESAVKILRTLDMSKVPCKVLRVKLERLAEKVRSWLVLSRVDNE